MDEQPDLKKQIKQENQISLKEQHGQELEEPNPSVALTQPTIKFPQWNQSLPVQVSQPWLNSSTRSISNPIIRMHNEIINFTQYMQPTPQEHQIKLRIFQQIQTQLKADNAVGTVLAPFLNNNLYLRGTELEIYAIVKGKKLNQDRNWEAVMKKIGENVGIQIYSLSTQLSQHQCRVIGLVVKDNVQVWVRFVPESWRNFLFQIDNSLVNSLEIKYIYTVVFCMLRQRSLHLAVRSLLIFGLCSFFAYERRKQRVRTLTENIIKFLQFFSIVFSHQQKERKIAYREGNGYTCTLNSDKLFSFEIADKVDISSRKIKQFFKVLHNRYKVLGNYYYYPGTSVLKHLVNPCSGEFFY